MRCRVRSRSVVGLRTIVIESDKIVRAGGDGCENVVEGKEFV